MKVSQPALSWISFGRGDCPMGLGLPKITLDAESAGVREP
jgi:hypothetical protein